MRNRVRLTRHTRSFRLPARRRGARRDLVLARAELLVGDLGYSILYIYIYIYMYTYIYIYIIISHIAIDYVMLYYKYTEYMRLYGVYHIV